MSRSAVDPLNPSGHGLPVPACEAMLVVNVAGKILLLNPQTEELFGYRRGELLGLQVRRILPEGFDQLTAACLRPDASLPQPTAIWIELMARSRDGSAIPIEVMLSPVHSAGRTLVMAAIRDVGVRRLTEAGLQEKMWELEHANEKLRHFACLTSHDLQEPLRTVAAYTSLLASRYRSRLDTDAEEFIALAEDGISRMQHLIQANLAGSRVDFKQAELAGISSEDALQLAMSNLAQAVEESGAKVTRGLLPMVLADRTELIQLFQNLIGNAIKYRRTDAVEVHIRATPAGARRWQFSVRDNGIGMRPHDLKAIFGMFQRLNGRKDIAGTGIGLAICQKIVERHGGILSVESLFGMGSTFCFSLADGRQQAPARRAPALPPAQSRFPASNPASDMHTC
jgi:PAS domain S-box-containing protein